MENAKNKYNINYIKIGCVREIVDKAIFDATEVPGYELMDNSKTYINNVTGC